MYRCALFGAVDSSWQTFERWKSFWLHAYIGPTCAEICSLLAALVIIILLITLCFPAPNFIKVVVIIFLQTVKIRNLFTAQMWLVSIFDSDTNLPFTEDKRNIHCKQQKSFTHPNWQADWKPPPQPCAVIDNAGKRSCQKWSPAGWQMSPNEEESDSTGILKRFHECFL